jgi:hemerythrin-like domain-containing protein
MRSRRKFLAAAPLVLLACRRAPQSEPNPPSEPKKEEEVTPTEDLMREHGVIERLLIVYEEAERRLEGDAPWPIEALAKSASIVRRFVEDYHEKQEEEDVFPRLVRANKVVSLVTTLRAQHLVGRGLTDTITTLAVPKTLGDAAAKKRLGETLRAFARMYRPHAAQEDTVVFPAFRELLTEAEMHAIGDKFEGREHALFGEHGFESIVAEVAGIEHQLGIDDISRFTPT